MKKLTIIAALAMATAAFAVPSTASAIWTHNHQHLQGSPQIHGEGSAAFQSSAGQINCTTVTSTIQLTGGQTTGVVNEFNANNVQTKCHTNGGIIGHCTVTSVTPVGLPWTGHINQTTGVQVTSVHISNDLHGFLCPDITLEFIAAGDNVQLTGEENGSTGHTTVDALHIEGQGTATPLENSVAISGTVSATASQADTYGWT
jgi:hypothetical protein